MSLSLSLHARLLGTHSRETVDANSAPAATDRASGLRYARSRSPVVATPDTSVSRWGVDERDAPAVVRTLTPARVETWPTHVVALVIIAALAVGMLVTWVLAVMGVWL